MASRSALASLNRLVLAAGAAIFLFGGGAVAWALLQPLSGAVIANGVVAVESAVKKVQPPTGGVVRRIAVTEGMHVAPGDVLIEIDDTSARINLAIVQNDLRAAQARLARLAAERDDKFEITFPAELVADAQTSADTRSVLADEAHVLKTRLDNRHGQKEQLGERIQQLEQRIEGLVVEREALEKQRQLATEELAELQDLIDQKLVRRARVSELQRELIKLDGSIGSSIAQIAESRGRQTEIRMQILGLDQDAARDVAKEIREVETEARDLTEKRAAALDQLQKSVIRAPEAGMVHQLAVHTVGGVVNPGEVLMQIVPNADQLIIEARIRPIDIDHVRMGQDTRLVFSAFARKRRGEVFGTVFRVAGDLSRDERGAEPPYYAVGIRLRPDDPNLPADEPLVPGMPVEVYIQTGERTVADYLVKPLAQQIGRAMRED
ncbi:HlyD family type I secretion periplasmic adaptor subunit [Bosea sp. 117]|uniref:HlyD family type I secretion periplasmic adaptor subunit n=1 Tax=Bosea sp. 117 TaxID=1125973 RepID=UPI000493EDB5|nr:HlyD family type I secretion periplasmic adaptor subunit [Bosea sp. 117]